MIDQVPSDLMPRHVSRETRDRLSSFVHLLEKWTKTVNLISRRDVEHIWSRHIADSLQVFDLVKGEGVSSGNWVDLGSGGGLPGVVVAILAREEAPAFRVTLVESDQRKAAFLRYVSRETECPFTVCDARIESLAPIAADVLSARALAPLSGLLGYAERHLSADGLAIFPKGVQHEAELLAAQRLWRFSWTSAPSITEPRAMVYMIRKVQRV